MAAIGMASAGLVLVVVTWIVYLGKMTRGGVSARPVGSVTAQGLGIGLALAGVATWLRGGASCAVAVLVPAALALLLGLFFLWLLSQRKTPVGDLKVSVGDTLLPFEVQTSDGARFHSSALGGKRTLLKFFRGGW